MAIRIRLFILLVLVLALLALIKRRPLDTAPRRTVSLTLIHGPETAPLLESAAHGFAKKFTETQLSAQISIRLVERANLAAVRDLAAGTLKGDAWLAPSTSAVNFVNATVRNLGARQIACQPVFLSPVVYAVPAGRAALLQSAPDRLALRRVFFGDQAVPTFAPASVPAIELSDPEYAAGGAPALLQLAQLAGERGQTGLEQLLAAVRFFSAGDRSLLKRSALLENRPAAVFVTTEQQLKAFNAGAPAPLRAVFPEEGTVVDDYQLCTSDADWVDSFQRGAIAALRQFLLEPETQTAAAQSGFRPARPPASGPSGEQLLFPVPTAAPATSAAFAELIGGWKRLTAPQAVLFVVESSARMRDRLGAVKAAVSAGLAKLPPPALTAVLSYDTQPQLTLSFGADPAQAPAALSLLEAGGTSAGYDALSRACELMSAPDLKRRRRSIIWISGGADQGSLIALPALLDTLERRLPDLDVRLTALVVEPPPEEDLSGVETLADRLGGRVFRLSPGEVGEKVKELADG